VKFLFKLIVLLSFAGLVFAQGHQATGVVKRIDAAAGVVSLKHDPIKSLGWPGMTMDFSVRDKKLLQGLKPEQKVSFEFVEEKSRYVITSIK
jgi:Cu(I)/Ag(I) efflux system periplasmic protein CusF